MSGLYFALSIVGLFIIVSWCVKNDGRARTAGILAMKEPPQSEAPNSHEVKELGQN